MTFLLVRQFLSYDRLHLLHVPIDVNPRVGGGGGRPDPGEFENFNLSQSQIPHPRAPRKCQIPTSRYCFLPKTSRSYLKFFDPRAEAECQNPHPGKSSPSQFPVDSPPPPPSPTLGLNIDRCIKRTCERAKDLDSLRLFSFDSLEEKKLIEIY